MNQIYKKKKNLCVLSTNCSNYGFLAETAVTMVNFHMGRPYRDSPVVWARLRETFFCMDSLKSPILRKYTRTEPQNRPRSRFWTSHRSQNSNSPVNAASRLHSHAHEGMKTCLIRAATETDFYLIISIASVSLTLRRNVTDIFHAFPSARRVRSRSIFRKTIHVHANLAFIPQAWSWHSQSA